MALPRFLTLSLLTLLMLAAGSDPAAAQAAKLAGSSPLARFQASLIPAPPPAEIKLRQSVYVPAYSSLAGSGGAAQLDLAVTLSVRNTSATLPLVIERIDYYDAAGNLVEHYAPVAVAIRPYGSIEILIQTHDVRGGTSANFVVDWGATAPIAEPVIEAVMVGSSGSRGFSFVSPGRPIHVVVP